MEKWVMLPIVIYILNLRKISLHPAVSFSHNENHGIG